MDDQQLAKRAIVIFGKFSPFWIDEQGLYCVPTDPTTKRVRNSHLSAFEFVRDPRPVMALMVMVAREGLHTSFGQTVPGAYDCHIQHIENDERNYVAEECNLARTIFEAAVNMLTADHDGHENG